MTVKAINSYFVDLNKDGNGCAFEVFNRRLLISFSFFVNLSVTVHGGSIFAEQSTCKIMKSSFYESYSTNHTNEKGIGNALYMIDGELIIDNINTRKCGASSLLCSDSSIRTTNCSVIVDSYNASDNYGIGGGAGISIIDALSGTRVKFLNVINAFDNYAIESRVLYTVSCSNFINTTHCYKSVVYQPSNYTIMFYTCIFINTKSPFSSYQYYSVNCFADIELSSIAYQANPNTINIAIELMNQCTVVRKNHRVRMKRDTLIL